MLITNSQWEEKNKMRVWNSSGSSDRILWGRLESDSRQLRWPLGDWCVSACVFPLQSPINKVSPSELLMTSWREGLVYACDRLCLCNRETNCHLVHFTALEWCVVVWTHDVRPYLEILTQYCTVWLQLLFFFFFFNYRLNCKLFWRLIDHSVFKFLILSIYQPMFGIFYLTSKQIQIQFLSVDWLIYLLIV